MHPVPRKFSQTAEKRCLVGMDRTPQPRILLLFWRHTPPCFRSAPTHQYELFGALPPCSPRLPARLRPYFHHCVGSLPLLRLYCSTASKSSKRRAIKTNRIRAARVNYTNRQRTRHKKKRMCLFLDTFFYLYLTVIDHRRALLLYGSYTGEHFPLYGLEHCTTTRRHIAYLIS